MDSSDDGFSDDGFDSLPAGELLELEQGAWQATQAPRDQLPDVVPRRNVNAFNGASLLKPAPLQRHASSLYENTDLGDWDAEILEDNNNNQQVEDLTGFDAHGAQHGNYQGNYQAIATTGTQQFARPTQRSNIAVEEQQIRTRIEEVRFAQNVADRPADDMRRRFHATMNRPCKKLLPPRRMQPKNLARSPS